jgi:hypothetical protein
VAGLTCKVHGKVHCRLHPSLPARRLPGLARTSQERLQGIKCRAVTEMEEGPSESS